MASLGHSNNNNKNNNNSNNSSSSSSNNTDNSNGKNNSNNNDTNVTTTATIGSTPSLPPSLSSLSSQQQQQWRVQVLQRIDAHVPALFRTVYTHCNSLPGMYLSLSLQIVIFLVLVFTSILSFHILFSSIRTAAATRGLLVEVATSQCKVPGVWGGE